MGKKTKTKKIRDIVVPEEELYGVPLEHDFVEEVKILRNSVASRLRALTTGYSNMDEEYKARLIGKELLRIQLYCLGVDDTWYVTVDGDGTVGFERRSDNDNVVERLEIPNDWTDEQILDFGMPEQLVKEYLKRQRWTPACFDAMLEKAERKLANALSAMVDCELKKVNSARKILNAAINDLNEERIHLQETGDKKDKAEKEIDAIRQSLQAKIAERKVQLAEKRKLRDKEEQTCRRLAEQIAKENQKLNIVRQKTANLTKKKKGEI